MNKPKNAFRNRIVYPLVVSCLLTGWGHSAQAQCTVPGGLAANQIYQTWFSVGWNTVSAATSYNYRWKLTSESTWQTSSSTNTGVVFMNRPADTQHDFQVQTVCGGITSPWSATLTIRTLPYPCPTPTGVTVSNVTAHSAYVDFDTVGGAISYSTYREVVGGSGFSYGTSSPGVTLSSLQANTQYRVRVRARCSGGWGAASDYLYFTTLATSCSAPDSPASTAVTNHQAILSWTNQTGAMDYTVRYRPTGGSTWSTAVAAQSPFTLSGLTQNTSYEWQVQTRCSGSSSEFSALVSFTTLPDCDAPTQFSESNITHTSATLQWGSSGASSYTVRFRHTDSTAWQDTMLVTTSLTLSGLSQTTTYQWQVQSHCTGLSSPFAAIRSFLTLNEPCNMPLNPMASSITTSTAMLGWGTVAGSAHYDVRIRATGTTPWTTHNTTGTSWQVTSLQEGTSYEWQVRTNCSGTSSGYTQPDTFLTAVSSCSTPENLTVSGMGIAGATLHWTPVSGATNYEVYSKSFNASSWTQHTAADTSRTLSGLTAETSHEWWVRAQCGPLYSDASDTTFFTTHSVSCPIPTNVLVTDTGDYGLIFDWDSVRDGSYAVSYRDTLDSAWTADTVFADSTILTNLIPGRTYELRVQTLCAGIASAFIPGTFATTLTVPCPRPLKPDTAFMGLDSAVLQWDSVPGALSYEVRYGTDGAGWKVAYPATNLLSIDSLALWSTYEWDIRAHCQTDTSIFTERVTFTTPFDSIMGPRETTVLDQTTTSAVLEWEALPGALSYEVSYRAADTTYWITQWVAGTSVSLINLQEATAYEWQVRAFFATDTSELVTSHFFTTEAPACEPSGILSASNVTGHTADLSWSAVPGNETFTVRYRPSGISPWQYAFASANTVQLDELLSQTSYEFQVQNECVYKTAPFSGSVFFTTDQAPPVQESCRPVNYAYMAVPRIPVLSQGGMESLSRSELVEGYLFVDGLGRKRQSVAVESSPTGRDVVINYTYDSTGTPTRTNLPFSFAYAGPEDDLRCQTNRDFYRAENDQVANTDHPYSEVRLARSPLQTVLESGSTGADWQLGGAHTAHVHHRINDAEEVRFWYWNGTAYTANHSFFPAGSLNVTESWVEQSRTVSYTTKDGRSVMAQTFNGPDTLMTCQIHDIYGNVLYRIPPMAVQAMKDRNDWTIDPEMLDTWVHAYTYDPDYHRPIEIHSPEKGLETVVYDRLGRIVLSQDENLRLRKQWNFAKYDVWGREVLSGLYKDTLHISRAAMQQFFDTNRLALYETRNGDDFAIQHGYSNHAFPDVTSSLCEIHFIKYYDDHDYDRDGDPDEVYVSAEDLSDDQAFDRIQGQSTAIKERILYDWASLVPQSSGEEPVDYRIFPGNATYAFCPPEYDLQFYTGTHIVIEVTATQNFETTVDQGGNLGAQEVCIGVDCLSEVGPLWLCKTSFYDDRGRVIGAFSSDHLFGTDSAHATYAFDGKINGFREKYITLGDTLILYDSLTYLANGLQERSYGRVNEETDWLLVSAVDYNELGQVIDRNLHSTDGGTTFLQSTDYRYHLHGGVTHINNRSLSNDANNLNEHGSSDLYGIEYAYDSDPSGLLGGMFESRYDGKISGQVWRYASEPHTRLYAFGYDTLGQLVRADYATAEGPVSQEDFSVPRLGYDLQGNILRADRKGAHWNGTAWSGYGDIDELHYSYSGNRLMGVFEAATDSSGLDFVYRAAESNKAAYESRIRTSGQEDYHYDANGNLIEDRQKGLVIEYNHLNLPVKVKFPDRSDSLVYLYSAAGTKLRKRATSGPGTTQVDYVRNAQYRDSAMQFIASPEGRLVPDPLVPNVFIREYNLKDLLGNVRVSFRAGSGGSVEMLQKRHYYPFGLGTGSIDSVFEASDANTYLYNGKELEQDLAGLGWYDYGLRFYDVQLARWHVVDPVNELFFPFSGYNYVLNDPVHFIDPDGTQPEYALEPNRPGMWVHHPESEAGGAYWERIPKESRVEGVHYEYYTCENGWLWERRLHPVYYESNGKLLHHDIGWSTFDSKPEPPPSISEPVVADPEPVTPVTPEVNDYFIASFPALETVVEPAGQLSMDLDEVVEIMNSNPALNVVLKVTPYTALGHLEENGITSNDLTSYMKNGQTVMRPDKKNTEWVTYQVLFQLQVRGIHDYLGGKLPPSRFRVEVGTVEDLKPPGGGASVRIQFNDGEGKEKRKR